MINGAMGQFVALSCAPELQRLLVIPRGGLGDIYLLEADGTPVGRYQWSDFRSFALLEDAEGYSVLFDTGGLNRFRGGSVIRDSLALIQYEYLSYVELEAREGATTIQTIVLNLKTGEVVHRTSEWPVVFDFGEWRCRGNAGHGLAGVPGVSGGGEVGGGGRYGLGRGTHARDRTSSDRFGGPSPSPTADGSRLGFSPVRAHRT
jgi:hypothetical protein